MDRVTKVDLHPWLKQKATKKKRCDYCGRTLPKYWVNADATVTRNVMRMPNGVWQCFSCRREGRI